MTSTGSPKIENILPLTPLQEGLVFHAAYDDGSAVYNVQLAVDLEGPLDVPVLRRSVDTLLRRHANLRASFRQRAQGDFIHVVQTEVRLPWKEWDLGESGEDADKSSLDQITDEDRTRRFDLAVAPLIRFTLIHRGRDRFRFLLTNHHIILDGWSMPLLVQDIFAIYSAGGSDAPLPPVAPYQNFLAWRARQDKEVAEHAWREALAGLEEGTRLAPNADSHSSVMPEQFEVALPEDLTTMITRQARLWGLTLNTVVQAAWGLLLARLTGRDDVLFATTVAGRPAELPAVESMIGLLINTVPLRVRLEPGEPIKGMLARLQEEQSRLLAHQHLGITDIQGLSGIDGTLFDTLTVFENYPLDQAADTIGDLRITDVTSHNTTHYPLSLIAQPGSRLTLQFGYRPDLFTRSAAERIAAGYAHLLRSIATADPETPVGGIDMLDPEERHRLLVEWNDTARETAHDTVAQQFQAQAAATPDRTAVVYGTESVSYLELDTRANQLATLLAQRNLGPEDIIALAIPRSTNMVVALLAVLKSGAAYLPIDPDYPPERIAFMLDDAKPALLITNDDTATHLPHTNQTPRLLIPGPQPVEGCVRQ